jgi:hypothetical protein
VHVEYAALQAGTLTAHSVERRKRLLLEGADGRPVASIGPGPEQHVAALEAANGTWTVHGLNASRWSGYESWSIQDAGGKEVGTLAKGRTERHIGLPNGEATWEYHALGAPHYRVEGLFSANRKPLHRFAPGLSHKPFAATVTDALVARPDHSLVLLLASWCTDGHISSKVQAATID